MKKDFNEAKKEYDEKYNEELKKSGCLLGI